MNIPDTIDLYEAINRMRILSQQGKTFSFVHATYNRDCAKTDGVRQVTRARLRPAAKGDDLTHADLKLFYFDEEIQKPRVCWQMLILFFEEKKVTLK